MKGLSYYSFHVVKQTLYQFVFEVNSNAKFVSTDNYVLLFFYHSNVSMPKNFLSFSVCASKLLMQTADVIRNSHA